MDLNKVKGIIVEDQDHQEQDWEEKENEEQEQISHKKALLVALYLVLSVLIGYVAFYTFDYYDNRNHMHDIKMEIAGMERDLNSAEPIIATVLEGYELDLEQLATEYAGKHKVLEEIALVRTRIDEHLAKISTGTNIYSWSTSQLLKTERDTVVALYKDRLKFSVKTAYLPITPLETKAYNLFKANPTWSKDDCIQIARREIWIGMTKPQLIASRGNPVSIDKNFSSAISHEQWAYGRMGPFIYVENGIVTSWQD